MKRLFIVALAVMGLAVARASELATTILTITNAGTNTTSTAAATRAISGVLYSIALDLSGATTPTAAVRICAATNSYAPFVKDLFPSNEVTADTTIYPVLLAATNGVTSELAVPFRLQSDWIRMEASDGNKTNINIRAFITVIKD